MFRKICELPICVFIFSNSGIIIVASRYLNNQRIYNTNSFLINLNLCRKIFVWLVLSNSSLSQLWNFESFRFFLGIVFQDLYCYIFYFNEIVGAIFFVRNR